MHASETAKAAHRVSSGDLRVEQFADQLNQSNDKIRWRAQARSYRAWTSHEVGRGRVDQDGCIFQAFVAERLIGLFESRAEAEAAVHGVR